MCYLFSVLQVLKQTKLCNCVNICLAAATVSKEELMVLAVSEIVAELIKAHEHGKDVNLNR